MCIICVSPKGIRQPDDQTIRTMFAHNPHGAGYMVARDGRVQISKGYMDIEEFLTAVHAERFTARDSVVYHFRISTQAGVNPGMTHPFPLSNRLRDMTALDLTCQCGVAHNGIIRLTSSAKETRYSDTALFIQKYLSRLIKAPEDLKNPELLNQVWDLAQSKFAILDGSGYVTTIGNFFNERGLLFSNGSYVKPRWTLAG